MTRGYEHHGMTKTPEYQVWRNIFNRCECPSARMWHRYGGRGIRMCEAWRESFAAFFDHVGPRPSDQHSIDRIDNDGHYEPGNVRWASRKEQQGNLGKSIRLTFHGETHCVREWSRRTGIPKNTILGRVHRGWPVDRTLTQVPAKAATSD